MPDHGHSYKNLFSHAEMVTDLLRGFMSGFPSWLTYTRRLDWSEHVLNAESLEEVLQNLK